MKSTFDKNAEKFVNLMVEKIESLSMNWQKPWFSKVNSKQNFLPQNLTGRTYSGGNAFLLYFLCEKYNYQTPVFLTFNQARNEGINVLKGAVAFPVYYTLFCAYHRQTNEKISYDEYNKLSEEEQKEYRLAAYTKYFQVFNLDQTNFAEKYPNRWDILKAKFSGEEQPQEEKEMYVNPILDEMNKNQNWVCPIQTVSSDSAFYSISNDSITLPLKSQFKDGESFYGTELHEMGHSTGVKNRLNRKGFYENDKFNYGREVENPLKVAPLIQSNLTPVKFFHSSILFILVFFVFFLSVMPGSTLNFVYKYNDSFLLLHLRSDSPKSSIRIA